jgi:putative ABC transport system permease protein
MIFKVLKRNLLSSKTFALIFIFNLFLGIIGFVVLHSFRGSVNGLLEQRAKELMSCDLTVSGRRDLKDEERDKVIKFLSPFSDNILRGTEVYSMAKALNTKGKTRLVDIISIQENFPLYGEVTYINQAKQEIKNFDKLFEAQKIIVSPEIIHQMKVAIGDSLKIGDLKFEIIGIIEKDSTTSWRGITLAPKLYMARKFLLETNLLGFGSVASYAHQIKLKKEFQSEEKIKEIKEAVEDLITDPAIRVRSPKNTSEQVGRVLNYLSDYLGLVGLVALFLSGIGAGYLFQNYLFDSLKDIAIMRSLGMSSANIIKIYLSELFILSSLSAVLANIVAYFFLPHLSQLLYGYINLNAQALHLTLETFVLSIAITSGASLLICIPILLKMLSKKIKHLFGGSSFFKFEFSYKDIFLFSPLILFLWGLSVYQAHSFKIGTLFSLALLIVGSLIITLFPLLFNFLDKFFFRGKALSIPGNLRIGMSMRALLRDKLSSTLTLTALTIGVMLLALIGQLEISLRGELNASDGKKPSLFLFDIQEEQEKDLISFGKEMGFPLRNPQAMVRSRITKINGKKYQRKKDEQQGFETRESQRSRRFRNRGVNLSFAKELNPSEKLVAGDWFKDDDINEISIEKRYADRMKITLGDTMSFDILGVEIQGTITSIRTVKWTSFLPNFFILFEDGVINDAPKSFISVVDQVSFQQQLEIQDLIVDKFPNVSIINVTEVIKKIVNIFDAMSLAIRIMALLCLLVGFFVLFAIIQNQLKRKKFDSAIQKIFGVTPIDLYKTMALEYLYIILVACFIGVGFSLILGFIVSSMFFDGVWKIDWNYNFGISIFITLATMLICYVMSRRYYKIQVKSLLK